MRVALEPYRMAGQPLTCTDLVEFQQADAYACIAPAATYPCPQETAGGCRNEHMHSWSLRHLPQTSRAGPSVSLHGGYTKGRPSRRLGSVGLLHSSDQRADLASRLAGHHPHTHKVTWQHSLHKGINRGTPACPQVEPPMTAALTHTCRGTQADLCVDQAAL